MKKLQLKLKDLTNPTILSHHEIKNIMGGSGDVSGSTNCVGKTMFNVVCYQPSEDYPSKATNGNTSCDENADYYMNMCTQLYPSTVKAVCQCW